MAAVELPARLPFLKSRTKLGEGCIFDPSTQRVLWIDIVKGKVFDYDPQTHACTQVDLRQSVGTVVPVDAARMVVAANKGICVVDRKTGRVLKYLGNPEAHKPENRWNDGKCDPQGRLWVGSMSNFGDPDAGALYSVTGEGTITQHVAPTSISNGLVWNAAGTKFWYIDTPTLHIKEYDFDAASGTISGGTPVISIDEKVHGYPDGCTIDADDKIWIAMWDGGCVLRCDPLNGTIMEKHKIPGATRITSCAFGGPNLDQLYITSASTGLLDDQLASPENENAGALFRLDLSQTGVRGVPAHLFKMA